MAHPSIHVVDDEPEIGRLVLMALGAQGYEVELFETGEAFAEAHGAASDPHLLIVDKNLPGISGFEVVERHHRDARGQFEAIMITGYADDASETEATRLGIREYIRKPFALDELRQAVARAEQRLAEQPRRERVSDPH